MRRLRLAILGSILAVLGQAAIARGALAVYEPFNYSYAPPPIALDKQSGGLGFSGAWYEYKEASKDTIRNGSLSFGALETSGNGLNAPAASAYWGWGRIGRDFSRAWGADAGTTVWASFLMRPTGASVSGQFGGLLLARNDGSTGEPILIGDSSEGKYVIEVEGGSLRSLSTVLSTKDVTAFLVVKYTFNGGLTTSDTLSLFVNPTPGGVAPTTPSASISAATSFNYMELMQSSARGYLFDEFRIGDTYADVAPTVLYWDASLGTSGAQGGSGAWSNAAGNWWNAGDNGNVNWNNANADGAVFAGSAGTVSVGEVTARSLRFDTAGYVLNGGTITLTSGAVAASQNATINSAITGSAGLSKSGAGVLTLNGANTYTGGTSVTEGTLLVTNASALPAGRSLAIGAGAALVLGSGLGASSGMNAGLARSLIQPRTGETTTVAFQKGTVPFSSNENWDSPPLVHSQVPGPVPEPSIVAMLVWGALAGVSGGLWKRARGFKRQR